MEIFPWVRGGGGGGGCRGGAEVAGCWHWQVIGKTYFPQEKEPFCQPTHLHCMFFLD